MVRETWLLDSIEKQGSQPLPAYDVMSDLTVEGKGIPWDNQDPGEEALESISAEVVQVFFFHLISCTVITNDLKL